MYKIMIGVVIAAAIVIIGFMLIDPKVNTQKTTNTTDVNNSQTGDSYTIEGEVNKPGTYLLSDSCTVTNLNWISGVPKNGQHVNAKFRYRQKDNGVTIEFISEDKIRLIFDEPYKAVTPGQAAVIYDEDICLGGGLIEHTYMKEKQTD